RQPPADHRRSWCEGGSSVGRHAAAFMWTGRHRAVRRGGPARRAVTASAAPLAAVLALALLPAVALAGERADRLQVVAPDQTDRGSVVVRGTTFPRGEVRLSGGLLPVTAFAAADGAF